MRGCLTVLGVLVVLVGLVGAGGCYYLIAPDRRPPKVALPSWEEVQLAVPLLGPPDNPMPEPSPELERLREQSEREREQLEARFQLVPDQRAREAQLRSQLQATGLPITGAFILENGSGEPTLAVSVDYERMTGGLSAGAGLEEAALALVQLAESGDLDLSGLEMVTVAVRDREERVLFGMTADVADVQRLRAGEIDRSAFVASTAARFESRAGVVDAVRRLVQP